MAFTEELHRAGCLWPYWKGAVHAIPRVRFTAEWVVLHNEWDEGEDQGEDNLSDEPGRESEIK